MVTKTTPTIGALFRLHPKLMTREDRCNALLELAKAFDTPFEAIHMLIGVIACCVNFADRIGTEQDVIEVCEPMSEELTAACIDCFRHAQGANSSAVPLQ